MRQRNRNFEGIMKMANITLTDLETELLKIWNKEPTFCSEVNRWQDSVWTFAVSDAWKAAGKSAKQLSGVMSSLVQKGIIWTEEAEQGMNDQCGFTDTGAELMESMFHRFSTGKEIKRLYEVTFLFNEVKVLVIVEVTSTAFFMDAITRQARNELKSKGVISVGIVEELNCTNIEDVTFSYVDGLKNT
jgi:hypothetical protein